EQVQLVHHPRSDDPDRDRTRPAPELVTGDPSGLVDVDSAYPELLDDGAQSARHPGQLRRARRAAMVDVGVEVHDEGAGAQLRKHQDPVPVEPAGQVAPRRGEVWATHRALRLPGFPAKADDMCPLLR